MTDDDKDNIKVLTDFGDLKKSKTIPPQFFLRFFEWYCHPKLHAYIEGDLMEVYYERLKAFGKRKADIRFIIDVLLLFRPGIIRPSEEYHLNHYGMYKNYLRTGWRNLVKQKVFSMINISGLALGLTCSVLIALWVQDEYSMNAFHEDIDRIFVVTSCEFSGDEMNGSHDTPGVLAEELKKVFPEVEYATNYAWTEFNVFAVGDKVMKQPGNFAGPDFFKIFSYPLVLGNSETALQSADNIAISRKMATRLFGSPELAMDKSVRFETYKDLKVTAVFEDLNSRSSEQFDYIAHWDFFLERNSWSKEWHNSGPETFIKIRQGADAEALKAKIREFLKNYDKEYTELDRLELGLQPYSEMYLNSNFKDGYISGGKIEYVRLFTFVAVFILLIACINFMNLSTARAVKRAKEIGVRKVIGAVRGSLVTQFMLEAFLFTLISIVFAVILIQLLLPQFNLLTGKDIQSPVLDVNFWMGMGVLTVVTGVISGSYPSFMLSSFKPISVLKSSVKMSGSSIFFRKGLVVVQFALSMIFIVGMIVISRQVEFIHTKNLGYRKENLIYIPLTGNIAKNFPTFKNEALKISGITDVSEISQRPVEIENTTGSVEWEGKPADFRPTFTQVAVGYDFIKTMRATLVAGRDFSLAYNDSAKYIINETALKVIGYENPIGMPLTFWGVKGTIIGVVKDFHFNSLHVPIEPLVIRVIRDVHWGSALIRTAPGATTPVLAKLESLHKKLNPDFPFAHQFADEEYGYLYRSEQVVQQLSGYFAFLAIFISSLGLLGLVMFTAEQRTKEVGIRKVLGATVSQIITLLSKDFLRLVFVSALFATPIAYYIMSEWLGGFEYQISIEWWMFVISIFGAVLIALVTVTLQAFKTAVSNPVDSLKSE